MSVKTSTEVNEIASVLLAQVHRLLDTYDIHITLWAGTAQFGQRCCLCGLWITEGDPVRSVYNVARSSRLGHPTGDYAHGTCPELPA